MSKSNSKVFGRGLFSGNFLIPIDPEIRYKVLKKLKLLVCSGDAYMPGRDNERKTLNAQILALEAFDRAMR